MKFIIIGLLFICSSKLVYALQQHTDTLFLDSSINKKLPLKLAHAEPLYIDLIRDLGARKGEKEWNIGMGLTDNSDFDEIELLVEYEWAAADRLGLELEVPVTLYSKNSQSPEQMTQPSNKIEGLKMAIQYTFLVKEKARTSMAIGYINEFTFTDLNQFGKQPFFNGNVFNPFLVVAKIWGANYHTLMYTGPSIYKPFNSKRTDIAYEMNSSLHYMIPNTKNFVGVEFNKSVYEGDFDMTIRPQMRVSVTDNLLIGVIVGIPFKRENQRFSSFLRLIYEPKQSHK
jgi:hypothetical protein